MEASTTAWAAAARTTPAVAPSFWAGSRTRRRLPRQQRWPPSPPGRSWSAVSSWSPWRTDLKIDGAIIKFQYHGHHLPILWEGVENFRKSTKMKATCLCDFPGLLAVISFFFAANLSSADELPVPFVILSPFFLFSPSSLSSSELSPSPPEEEEESLPDDDEDESDIILSPHSTQVRPVCSQFSHVSKPFYTGFRILLQGEPIGTGPGLGWL